MEKFTKIANIIYKKQQKLYNEVRMYLYKKEKQEKDTKIKDKRGKL